MPDATKGDSGIPGGDRIRFGAKVTLLGLVVYLVSWFFPVCRGEAFWGPTEFFLGILPHTSLPTLPEGPEWLPGWQAVRIACWSLTSTEVRAEDVVRARALGCTAMTNIVMLIGMLTVSARRTNAWAGSILIACAVYNSSWIYLLSDKERPTYLLGYYCWLASFALTGAGLMIPRSSSVRS